MLKLNGFKVATIQVYVHCGHIH